MLIVRMERFTDYKAVERYTGNLHIDYTVIRKMVLVYIPMSSFVCHGNIYVYQAMVILHSMHVLDQATIPLVYMVGCISMGYIVYKTQN